MRASPSLVACLLVGCTGQGLTPVDTEPGGDTPVVDTDTEPDSDSDTEPDTDTELGWDATTDSDADGLPDAVEGRTPEDGGPDSDGDGALDWQDPTNEGPAPTITLEAITTPFNSPIGIDFHEPTRTVVLSVNYSSGTPVGFERIGSDGAHTPFSTLSGLTDEVKIATVRSHNPGGFTYGELFVGNGIDGQIVRISSDGATVTNPWVDLPGDGNGLMRGSLYLDRTGVWGGDLLVATTSGEVWRVDAAGNPTRVATLPGVHLEGLISVPDAPARYGPLAGRILAGAEGQGQLHAFDTAGGVQTYEVGVNVEDIDLVMPGEAFFGVNFGTSTLLGAEASDFATVKGDILLTQESHGNVGLYVLRWDGAALVAQELGVAPGGPTIGQWEHVTFAGARIKEVGEE